jgi:hypothetical protein
MFSRLAEAVAIRSWSNTERAKFWPSHLDDAPARRSIAAFAACRARRL